MGRDWGNDGTDVCAICSKEHQMNKLVVCKGCFNKVMSSKKDTVVPVLFSKWSKECLE